MMDDGDGDGGGFDGGLGFIAEPVPGPSDAGVQRVVEAQSYGDVPSWAAAYAVDRAQRERDRAAMRKAAVHSASSYAPSAHYRLGTFTFTFAKTGR